MRRDDAQREIVRLWRAWRDDMREMGMLPRDQGARVHLFWEFLQSGHPHVLDFASHGQYEQMLAWVLEDEGGTARLLTVDREGNWVAGDEAQLE